MTKGMMFGWALVALGWFTIFAVVMNISAPYRNAEYFRKGLAEVSRNFHDNYSAEKFRLFVRGD